MKWPAGASSGILVAGGNGYGDADNQVNGFGPISVDSTGNVFILGGRRIQKWAPGATSGINVASWNPSTFQYSLTDIWVDRKDTIYLTGYNNTNGALTILKWAPGASNPMTIGMTASSQDINPTLVMDIKGDIYSNNYDTALYEFPRTSSIPMSYTPSSPGSYYAIATDMQGYAAMTNPVVINDPSTGIPSIQISATATSTPVCTPISFAASVTGANGGASAGADPYYQWVVSGVRVGGDSTTYSHNLFANGDKVYCILTAEAGCAGTVTDTSNNITLAIDPHGTASVSITSAPKDTICQGDSINFTATVANGSNQPVFEWLLNGLNTGDDSATYTRNDLSNGDVVTCLITSDNVCGLAKSNSIPLTVSMPPSVQPGQVFTILKGQSLTLNPVTTGDISSYLWTPATGLSDPMIADPVADLDSNILYTLKVTAPGGCSDSASILVNVYTPVSLPGAFTPNGDGHNDLFYVLGGPVNSRVEEFAVFNRQGAEVFHVHGIAPGDPTFAWNGTFHGSPVPTGVYVYIVVMEFAGGSRQVYKGTVVLIR